jgi:hypothetical protein
MGKTDEHTDGSFLNDAITFKNAVGYSFNGGSDLAILNDSRGNDTFSGSGNTGTLTLGTTSAQTETTIGFGSVNIVSA